MQAREPTPEDYEDLRKIAAANVHGAHRAHRAPPRAHEVWLERLLARAVRAIRKLRNR